MGRLLTDSTPGPQARPTVLRHRMSEALVSSSEGKELTLLDCRDAWSQCLRWTRAARGPRRGTPQWGGRLASRGVRLTRAPEPGETPALETQWSGPTCRSRGGGGRPEGARELPRNDDHMPRKSVNGFPLSHEDPGNCSRKLASTPDYVKRNVSDTRME